MFNFEARQKLIQERERQLAAYMAQQQQGMPQGQMVSGHYVAPSIFQSINAAITPAINSAVTRKELERLRTEMSEADRLEAINHIQSKPQGRDEQQGPVDPSNPTELEAKPANAMDVAKWQQEGLQIPSRKALIEKLMLDTELNEPIRAEGRADKAQARRDTEAEAQRQRIERGEQSAADRADRDKRERDLARQRSEDLRYTTDQNNQTRRMMIEAQISKGVDADRKLTS